MQNVELHQTLGARIVSKAKAVLTKGYNGTVELTNDLLPYFYQMCDSYGSSILTQIATDLNEDMARREEFNEWKNKLNSKSLKFIKTNIAIYKEAKKQIFEIPFIKNYEHLFNDIKQDLINNDVIKRTDTLNEIGDKTHTFTLNHKSLKTLESNVRLKHENVMNNFDFKKLLDKNNIQELDACGSCLVSVGHITKKQDLIKIGSGIIGACNIGNAIHNMLSSGNAGPFGIAAGILSGIATIIGAFQKNDNNNQLQEFLVNLSNFLCQMRNEMHERFNRIELALNEQQRLYLNNFTQIHANVQLIQNMVEYTNLKIYVVEEKINALNENMDVQFEKMLNVITFDKIIAERERIMREIAAIKLSEHFDLNLQNIIANLLNTNEALSGYTRIELFKERENLGYEFNVNTAVQIVAALNIQNMHVNETNLTNLFKHDEYFKGFIFYTFLTNEMLNTLGVNHFIVVNMLGSFVIIEKKINEISCYGSEKNYVKLLSQNVHTVHHENNCSYEEILTYANVRNVETFKDNSVYDVYDIEHLQNPLLFSSLLNILMNKINEQKINGHFVEGFMTIRMYDELLKIVNQMYKYYFFVKTCRTPKIYEPLTAEHNLKLQTLNDSIQNYHKQKYDLEYERLLINLNKIYIRETTNLMNEYENQTIEIKKTYSSLWFHRHYLHHEGRNACGQRGYWDYHHALETDYVNKMIELLRVHKITSLETVRKNMKALNHFEKITISNFTKHIPKYMPEFMTPLNPEHPILKTFHLKKMIPDDIFVLQFLNPEKYLIKISYSIRKTIFKIIITVDNIEIFTGTIDYTPLHYVEKEAIVLFWHGGNMNEDITKTEIEREDKSYETSNNKWLLTTHYPIFTKREAGYLKFNEMNNFLIKVYLKEKNIETLKLEIDNIFISFKHLCDDDMKNNKNIIKVLNEYDFIYNKIKLLLECGNVKLYFYKNNITINETTFENTPETCEWLNYGDTSLRFIQLMHDIKNYVRTNITPTEKLKYSYEMTETLLKVMLFIETNRDALKNFDVSGFMSSVSNDYNEELNKGNKICFNDFLKKRLLCLPAAMHSLL